MRILQNLSIKKKLIGIISLVAVLTLGVGFTVVILYEVRAAKVKLVEDSRLYARLIADISVPALASNDRRGAERSLAKLQSVPMIMQAVVYDAGGNAFAAYSGSEEAFAPPPLDNELTFAYKEGFLDILQSVSANNRDYGKVLLRVSTRGLEARKRSYLVTMLILLAVLIAISFFLARLMQDVISKPIIGLMGVTKKVASTKESAALVKKKTRNELDILRNRFNFILEQIQIRETENEARLKTREEMEELQASEKKFRQIFEEMVHSVAVLEAVDEGKDFIFRDLNSAGEKLEHIHRADLVGMRISEVFPGVKTHGLLDVFRQVWKTGDAAHHPLSQFKEEKNAGWRETYVYKLSSGAIVAVYTDVTERKQREEEQKKADEAKLEAEEALKQAEDAQKKAQVEVEPRILKKKAQLEATHRELEAFFHAVSNDLAAPLDGIDECSKAFLENYAYSLDDKGKDFLIRIRAASQRMLQLFQDIAQLSQISLGELRSKPVDLSALAHKKVIELKEGSPDRKAEFIIKEGITAQGDSRLLGVLIEQLFNNSWTYTAQKTKTKIEFGMTENGEEPEFFVKDNGLGFEMAKAEKIFVPFQTLHNDEVYPGTGMGLAIVRRIVHKHGGIIRVKSRPGRGTTVFFTLGDIPEGESAASS